MSSARMPPPPRNASAVTMYMIPIRLWSTVTSQLAMRPRCQRTGYSASDLTATRGSLVDVLLHEREQRVELARRPVVSHGRHTAAAAAHDRDHSGGLDEQRVVRECGPVVPLAGQPVALRAGAAPLRAAEVDARDLGDVALVV